MHFMNRSTRILALILSATFVTGLGATVGVQSKAAMSSARSWARPEPQQDSNARVVTARPLRDWLLRANELRASGLIDLNSEVEFTVEAKRNSDCRLGDAVIVQNSGDQRFLEVMRELLAALSDSGLLAHLGVRPDPEFANTPCVSIPLHFNFMNDSSQTVSSFEYPANTPEQAVQVARAYNLLIEAGRTMKRGHPDELVYNAIHATSEGNHVIVHFRMSRTNVDDILRSLLTR
jgi:hypothetical protein